MFCRGQISHLRHPIARVCVQVWSGFWLNIKLDWSFLLTPSTIDNHLLYGICRVFFLMQSWIFTKELLNALRPFCLSTMQLSSQYNTLHFFLPSFLNAGFTSTYVQRVLGHSECLCSKLREVKQSCGHAVTTLSPIGPQNNCLWASTSSLIRCVLENPRNSSQLTARFYSWHIYNIVSPIWKLTMNCDIIHEYTSESMKVWMNICWNIKINDLWMWFIVGCIM